jgi:hypothetical protein
VRICAGGDQRWSSLPRPCNPTVTSLMGIFRQLRVSNPYAGLNAYHFVAPAGLKDFPAARFPLPPKKQARPNR